MKCRFRKVCYSSYIFKMFVLLNVFTVFSVNANAILSKITEIEKRLDVRVGVSIYDVTANDSWSYQGDIRFPLMSTFKTLACANLLADIDKGIQFFNASVVISKESIIAWSPVTEKHIGETFTLKQACSAAMIMSDNTATNIILSAINGPSDFTQFMRSIGDNVTRLDRIEPSLNEAFDGDQRDTTTPNAIVNSLNNLLFGNVLSKASKIQLKQWMIENKVTGSLLRSVLPDGWIIADRSGAGGYGSRAITAVVWSTERSPIIISIYLTQTKASFKERDKAIADIGREIFKAYN